MNKTNLIFVILICLVGFSSALSVNGFFNEVKNSTSNYYVYYNGENSYILQNSQTLAANLGIGFSTTFIPNKNYLGVIVPPYLLGELYWFENNFSYLQTISTSEANLLMIYISNINKTENEFENEINLVFNKLNEPELFGQEEFYLFSESSFQGDKSYGCDGFLETDSSTKNIFSVGGSTFEDECTDNRNLLKMKCEESLIFENFECEGFCSEGRCVENEGVFSIVKKWVSDDSPSYFERILRFFIR